MTAKRPTRKPIAEVIGLDAECRRTLLTGFGLRFNGYCGDKRDPEIRSRMQADWIEYREDLLADWIEENPGRRPWAWWEFDAVERRETVDGSVHPFDRPERRKQAERWHRMYPKVGHLEKMFELYFGRPNISCGEGLIRYEVEAAYLTRLNLLLPGEAESLKHQ